MNHHELMLTAIEQALPKAEAEFHSMVKPILFPEIDPKTTVTAVNIGTQAYKITIESIGVCEDLMPDGVEYPAETHGDCS